MDLILKPPKIAAHRVEVARRIVIDTLKRIGWAEGIWVAQQFCLEYGIEHTDDGKVRIRLDDLQLIGYAAALKAHHEYLRTEFYGQATASKEEVRRGKGTTAKSSQKRQARRARVRR